MKVKETSLITASSMKLSVLASACVFTLASMCGAEPLTLNLWPGKPPGETNVLPPEEDQTKETDRLVGGGRIIKLGQVSTPQIAVYRPANDKDTGASVVICPGGGHNILAYDLEGTEVAEWLNTLGVTGIVLKYRVPTRTPNERRWLAAVQDAQRAMSLARSEAAGWGLDPKRIGILGFSAGGETAALTALFSERQYEAIDAIDRVSSRPDFAALVYPAYLTAPGKEQQGLLPHVRVTKDSPPMFLAHAYDDRISPLNSVLLFVELKKAAVPAELHVYSRGGHGYGIRATDDPVTSWHHRCGEWMRREGYLSR
jgi:acetyl esterase/lipase